MIKKKVYKLARFLYGLKQVPKQLHEKFDKAVLLNVFHHNSVNKCMYSKFTKDFCVIICLYVDDMLIFSTNMIGKVETKRCLTYIFKMKDLSKVGTILGIKVKKHSSDYAPNQSHYTIKSNK
jgi:ribosome biogenesis protein Nip4